MKVNFLLFIILLPFSMFYSTSLQSQKTVSTSTPTRVSSDLWQAIWLQNPRKVTVDAPDEDIERPSVINADSAIVAIKELDHIIGSINKNGHSKRRLKTGLYTITFECHLEKQQWPVHVEKSASCGYASWKDSSLHDNDAYLITYWVEKWADAIPRLKRSLIKNAVWERKEKKGENVAYVNISAEFTVPVNQLEMWRGYLSAQALKSDIVHASGLAP